MQYDGGAVLRTMLLNLSNIIPKMLNKMTYIEEIYVYKHIDSYDV